MTLLTNVSFLMATVFSATSAFAFPGLCDKMFNGNGESVYHPNGQLATSYAGREGASWYHSNGNLFTSYAAREGASTYHANGNLLSSYTGRAGASWYWSNGNLLSSYMGRANATWYYENGNIWESRGPALSSRQMWEYACELALE